MSDTTTTRFRIKKTVGSPSVVGASGIETLASHTNNPSAHPDYMKKGALPAYFSGSEHMTDKLAHCATYARRSEVMTNKLDYEQTKNMSLTNDVSNYSATSGVKRYILTSYVLNRILSDYGFDGSKVYIETNKIVLKPSTVPVGYEQHYVVGWPLFKNLSNLVDYINANYLTLPVARSIFVTQETFNAHTHEIVDIRGAMVVLGYSLTEDLLFQSGKTYYRYDRTFHAMVVASDFRPGETIPANTYFEKDSDKYAGGAHEHTIFAINGGVPCLGYVKTIDTAPVTGKTYYKYNTASRAMEISSDTTFDPKTVYFEKLITEQAANDKFAAKTDISCLEYTVTLDSEPTAGTAVNVGTLPDGVDTKKIGFEVVLIGTKTVDGVPHTYTWINPTAEIADINTVATAALDSRRYIPIYVNSQSLVTCSVNTTVTCSVNTTGATIWFTHPHSWLDAARVSGTVSGIQDMDSLALKIRVIKRLIATA